jgi:hypothetical protein
VTKILGYDFEIVYKKGKKNVVVDALSRKDEDFEAFLYAILIIQPDWIIEARDEWKNDENEWTLILRLQQDSSASDTFTWKNDLLWYKVSDGEIAMELRIHIKVHVAQVSALDSLQLWRYTL